MFFPPCHSFCDGILVRTGKSGKYQFSCVGLTGRYFHPGDPFVHFTDVAHIGKIQSRIDALGKHVHGERNDIYVAGALSVAKKRSLDPVCSGEDAKFCVTDAGSSVIVRMKGEDHTFPVKEVFIEIFHLACKYMGHCIFHSGRKVDDRFILWSGAPDIKNRIADLQRVIHFCTLETFRAVFKSKIAGCLFGQFLQKCGAVYGDLFDLFFVLFKHLLSLRHRGGIVHMDNGVGSAFDRLKSPLDNMLSRLGEHLDGHIVRNHILLDQCS